jgi:galactitol-specific phosphotransferase system IIC component
MSLLHQESQSELDDAARGESFTKGSSHIVWASVAAAVVITILIAIYVIAGEKPPVANVEILDVWAHPMHEVTPSFDAAGASVSQSTFDQVLVFAHVRLRNQSKGPLFLHQIMTNVTHPDGSVDTSFATTASQYERIFQAYPDLAQWRSTPINTELTLETGQTAEGTFVSSFRMTKEQWDARKTLDFTFEFRYQPDVKAAATVAVTDR